MPHFLLERTYNRNSGGRAYCIGHLYLLDQYGKKSKYLCDTIEDISRHLTNNMAESEILAKKVKSKTAIPTGKYGIALNTKSPKFSNPYYASGFYHAYNGGYVPRLMQVKGFEGILIHAGTNENSSAGCIIVGENKVVGAVINSRKTWLRLMDDYFSPARRAGQPCYITITETFKV